MKTRLICMLFCFALLSCGGIKTYTDYDETAEFDQYTSFDFYEDMETGLDTLDQKRFTAALTDALKEKGLKNKATPDFKINYYSDFFKNEDQHNINIGMGTIGSHVGGNISSGIPLRFKEYIISLTIEFVDAETDELYWQAIGEGKFNPNMPPEKRTEFFKKLAKKAVKDYPPDR